jgi:hypothetical protein
LQEVEGSVCCSSTLYAGSGAIRPLKHPLILYDGKSLSDHPRLL